MKPKPTAVILAPILLVAYLSLAYSSGNQPRFDGKMILEDVADKYVNVPGDIGHTEFKLLVSYSFIDKTGRKWTAPAGTVVNGASIPQAAWSIIGGPWAGRHRNAAVVHDYHCQELVEDSKTVHRIFYEGLIANGVKISKAKIMYYAVLVGGPRWTKGAGFDGVTRGDISEAELKKLVADGSLDALEVDQIEDKALKL